MQINLGDYSTPPVITKGGFDQRNRYNSPGQTTFQAVKVKEEPKDNFGGANKTQNQAYFCRKCYKVFFKLDEFNAHSKNCDYSNYSPNNARLSQGSPGANNQAVKGPIKIKQEPGLERRANGGDISNAGRPLRNCAKDIGPYKVSFFGKMYWSVFNIRFKKGRSLHSKTNPERNGTRSATKFHLSHLRHSLPHHLFPQQSHAYPQRRGHGQWGQSPNDCSTNHPEATAATATAAHVPNAEGGFATTPETNATAHWTTNGTVQRS